MVVAVFEKLAHGELGVCLDQPETHNSVRLQHTKLRREHHVAHERENRRRCARDVAEEVVDVRELRFGAEDAADRAEGNTQVAPLVLTVGHFRATRIAPEVVAKEWTDVRLRRRLIGYPEHEQGGERARCDYPSNLRSVHRVHLVAGLDARMSPARNAVIYNSFPRRSS